MRASVGFLPPESYPCLDFGTFHAFSKSQACCSWSLHTVDLGREETLPVDATAISYFIRTAWHGSCDALGDAVSGSTSNRVRTDSESWRRSSLLCPSFRGLLEDSRHMTDFLMDTLRKSIEGLSGTMKRHSASSPLSFYPAVCRISHG